MIARWSSRSRSEARAKAVGSQVQYVVRLGLGGRLCSCTPAPPPRVSCPVCAASIGSLSTLGGAKVNGTKLPQHSQVIPDSAMFDHLAIDHTEDVHLLLCNGFPCGRNPHKLARLLP